MLENNINPNIPTKSSHTNIITSEIYSQSKDEVIFFFSIMHTCIFGFYFVYKVDNMAFLSDEDGYFTDSTSSSEIILIDVVTRK